MYPMYSFIQTSLAMSETCKNCTMETVLGLISVSKSGRPLEHISNDCIEQTNSGSTYSTIIAYHYQIYFTE